MYLLLYKIKNREIYGGNKSKYNVGWKNDYSLFYTKKRNNYQILNVWFKGKEVMIAL